MDTAHHPARLCEVIKWPGFKGLGFQLNSTTKTWNHTALRCFLACYPSSSSTAPAPTGTDRLVHAQISQISRKLLYLLIQVT